MEYSVVSEAMLAVRVAMLAVSVALFSTSCANVVHLCVAATARLSRYPSRRINVSGEIVVSSFPDTILAILVVDVAPTASIAICKRCGQHGNAFSMLPRFYCCVPILPNRWLVVGTRIDVEAMTKS